MAIFAQFIGLLDKMHESEHENALEHLCSRIDTDKIERVVGNVLGQRKAHRETPVKQEPAKPAASSKKKASSKKE